VPIFDWGGLDGWGVLRAVMFAGSPGDAASARVAAEIFREGIRPDEVAAARLARTRWLEVNDAEASFPCGIVPQPEVRPDAPRLNVVPLVREAMAPVHVLAVVLPTDLVFIPEDQGSEEITELGRLSRSAIRDVDVLDAAGVHVPEPARETFEPDAISLVALRWTNGDVEEEERFAFRSAWLAWRAARRLRDAMLAAG
jgi:hypothetical protein